MSSCSIQIGRVDCWPAVKVVTITSAKPHRFRRDQDALGIHAVQDIFEAAAFLAEAVLDRDLEILEEQFVGIDGLAAHLLDLVHRNPLAIEIGVEQAQALAAAALLGREKPPFYPTAAATLRSSFVIR